MKYGIVCPHSTTASVNEETLGQRQHRGRLSRAMHAIRLHPIILWIDLHLRHCIVKFHIFLTDITTAFDGFNPFPEAVGGNIAVLDGREGDE